MRRYQDRPDMKKDVLDESLPDASAIPYSTALCDSRTPSFSMGRCAALNCTSQPTIKATTDIAGPGVSRGIIPPLVEHA